MSNLRYSKKHITRIYNCLASFLMIWIVEVKCNSMNSRMTFTTYHISREMRFFRRPQSSRITVTDFKSNSNWSNIFNCQLSCLLLEKMQRKFRFKFEKMKHYSSTNQVILNFLGSSGECHTVILNLRQECEAWEFLLIWNTVLIWFVIIVLWRHKI